MFSLKTKIAVGLGCVVTYGLLIVLVALSLPKSSPSLGVPQQFNVTSFKVDERRVPMHAELSLEEPDVLSTYSAMNALFATHELLHEALANGQLEMQLADKRAVPVQATQRTLTDLPGMFWLQLFCGIFGMLICILVWVPASRDTAIHAFALTGLANLLFTSTAAIYSTRDFFIDGSLFRLLSAVNHTGALLFSAALAVFLWNYPQQSKSPWVNGLFVLLFFTALGLDQLQLTASPVSGFHSWVMAIFLLGLLGAGYQFWQTRRQPRQRAALGWVILSILAGTTFFAGGMILPAILQSTPPASQGLLFTTFLLMYVGIALGVGRHRLFDLDRWWYALWSWLLGGVMVMLADLLLVGLLELSNTASLAFAVILVGWLYFPLRQWLWRKLLQRETRQLDDWLATALPAMLDAQRKRLGTGLEEALQAVFQPLSIEYKPSPYSSAATEVLNQGRSLRVVLTSDGTDEHMAWHLEHAHQGEALFKKSDERTADLVVSLYRLVAQANTAYTEGVREERRRIRRDMHDDLGAKLLHLLHMSSHESKPLVRAAIKDLRQLLDELEGDALPLAAAIEHWYEETRQRCADHNVQLIWQAEVTDIPLGIDRVSELTRILREAISNALKHALVREINVTIRVDAHALVLKVVNDGVSKEVLGPFTGGIKNMSTRAELIGGLFTHTCHPPSWEVAVEVALTR